MSYLGVKNVRNWWMREKKELKFIKKKNKKEKVIVYESQIII